MGESLIGHIVVAPLYMPDDLSALHGLALERLMAIKGYYDSGRGPDQWEALTHVFEGASLIEEEDLAWLNKLPDIAYAAELPGRVEKLYKDEYRDVITRDLPGDEAQVFAAAGVIWGDEIFSVGDGYQLIKELKLLDLEEEAGLT